MGLDSVSSRSDPVHLDIPCGQDIHLRESASTDHCYNVSVKNENVIENAALFSWIPLFLCSFIQYTKKNL